MEKNPNNLDTDFGLETAVTAPVSTDMAANQATESIVAEAKTIPALNNVAEKITGRRSTSIIPDEQDKVIRVYEDQNDVAAKDIQAYVVVKEQESVFQASFDPSDPNSIAGMNRVRKVVKTGIKSGDVSDMADFVADMTNGEWPNLRIWTGEFLESSVIAQRFKQRVSEKAYNNAIKRAGSAEDAPFVTLKGEKIIRFSNVEISGTVSDILVKHDNYDEISAYNAGIRESINSNSKKSENSSADDASEKELEALMNAENKTEKKGSKKELETSEK